MLRKTVFTIFLVLFLLGCVLLLAAGTLSGQLSGNLPLANLIGDAGLPLVFLGVGGMLMLPVMGKASRRGRHFYRVLGVGIPLIYLASLLIPGLWLTASWLTEYPALFLIPGFSRPPPTPGRSPPPGKNVKKRKKKKKKPPYGIAAPLGAAFFSFVGRQRRKNVV